MTDLHQFSDAEEEEEAPKPFKVGDFLNYFLIERNFMLNCLLPYFTGKLDQ